MKRIRRLIIWLLALRAIAAVAATATSNEFRLDFYGLGPWERRVARSTETIAYSTAWATNLTAAQQANATSVVKVYPCLKTPPKYLVVDMSGGRSAARWPISYLDEVPSGGWTDEYKTSKLVLRYIPAGSFIMGGRNTDYPGAVNTNLHMVTLTKPFYMGVFECTQRQWELAMGTRPSFFTNATCYATRPVEQVSYRMVKDMIRVLQVKSGIALDIPDCEQWEYACRAGTATGLNSGKNVEQLDLLDRNLAEVARYGHNSGRADGTYDWDGDASSCTAVVGSYVPNSWGLYDMHGNVWEITHGGGNGLASCQGGGWNTIASRCTASVCDVNSEDYLYWNCGCRICLPGKCVPRGEQCEVLVNHSGESTVYWTPAHTGIYQLSHEVQTNGVTIAPVETAWFEVCGPQLSFAANGELEPGVGVAVAGNEPGWTVYCSTDGTEPTTNATVYVGAITLNETTTIRAVAYNAQGVRSEEASATFTLHDALSVVGAVARPRYPWNGKVDVDVELKGDPEAQYLVELEAKDLAGGTNLPVRTVACGRANTPGSPSLASDGIAVGDGAAGVRALPGVYRFTWDAAADIEGDFDFNRVAVTVKATGSHLLAYPKTMELTVTGYTGTEVLTNVPTLVRLSTNITGFVYSDFATTNGTDLAFFTEDGRALPYEIDEWNVGGESLVWVKLPTLANGTSFICAYGAQSNNRTIEQSNNPHAVWREYAGVWHMNEDSGTAFDSTEHHLDGIPSCGTNELADVNQMVAYENGACGRARVNGMAELEAGNFMMVPSYDALGLKDCFVVSGWFNIRSAESYPKLIVRSDLWTDGWGIEVDKNNLGKINVVGGVRESHLSAFLSSDLTTGWTSLAFCYEGDAVSVYENGVCLTNNVVIGAATENGRPLAFGNRPNGLNRSLCGQYDEIRLRGGSLSADRIRADYDMIANREFLSYGAVRLGSEAAK